MSKRKFTALGANIFAGLFTQGVKQAGFEVLGHLEHGPYGVATAKLNHPNLEVRVGREHWNEGDFKGKVDFMYTNPPCAAWSTARSAKGGDWKEQVGRLRCVHDCVQAGIAIKPKAWAWESVTQAWSVGQEFVLQQAEAWNDVGYHCTVLLQDNQYLGAPQARRRMFLIAHKHPLVWPKLTEPMTVAEAFKNLPRKQREMDLRPPPFQPLWKRLWKMSDHYSGYFRAAFEQEGRGPKNLPGRIPSVMVRKVLLDQPAPVMMGASLRLHPTEVRYLNWYEWLALVGLPMTWRTSLGSLDAASNELGRAVLPAVGKWLATAVKGGLEMPPLKGRPTTTLVDFRDPDKKLERVLFTYDGPTIKPIVPPPLPPLKEPRVSGPRAPRIGGPGKPGVGVRIRELIKKGEETEAILKTIHKEFKGSKATAADVAWNRGKLRKAGEL